MRTWSRVGKLVRERRLDLGMTQEELAASAGKDLSSATLGKIERGGADLYRDATLRTLCKALAWTSDSIDRILGGADPVVVVVPGNHDIDALPRGSAPEGDIVDLGGLPPEDRAMIRAQVERLRRLNGIEE
jgi:transcriptional regulator with XRE-family HTH domain